MDNRIGEMVPVSSDLCDELESKGVDGVFRVGEVVEVKGSRMRVQTINRKRVTLKLLPRKQD